MTDKKPRGGRGTRLRRVLKWIGIGVLALIVVYSVGGVGLNWLSHARAGSNAEEGYESWHTSLRGWQTESAEALGPIWGEPLAAREQVSCSSYPADRGWFVAEYRHLCRLTYVEVYAAPPEAAQARDELAGIPAAESLFGPDEFRETAECPKLRETGWTQDEPWVEVMYLPANTLQEDGACAREIAAHRADHRDVDFQERTEGDLTPAAESGDPVVAVIWRQTISSDRLGCNPFVPVFCEEPFWTGAQLPE